MLYKLIPVLLLSLTINAEVKNYSAEYEFISEEITIAGTRALDINESLSSLSFKANNYNSEKKNLNESAKTPIPKKVQPIKASINNKKPDTDKTDAPNGEKNTDNSSNENHLSSDKWNELLLNMNLTPFLKNYYFNLEFVKQEKDR